MINRGLELLKWLEEDLENVGARGYSLHLLMEAYNLQKCQIYRIYILLFPCLMSLQLLACKPYFLNLLRLEHLS